MVQLFHFSAGGLRCAVPLAAIQSVIQMMEITPPSSPRKGLEGTINLHGRLIPVYSLRELLGAGGRQPRLSDMLLIAQAGEDPVALWVDETRGVDDLELRVTSPPEHEEKTFPVQGITISLPGIVIITDLPAFLAGVPDPHLLDTLSAIRAAGDTPPIQIPDDTGPEGNRVKAILHGRAAKMVHPEPGTTIAEMTEILRFQLAYQEYGIEMSYVREVILTGEITPVPGTPDFISGICAARGQIISLVDLRALFRIPEKGLTDLNRVIVITNGAITFGILADTISGVGTIALKQVRGQQSGEFAGSPQYFKGVLGGMLVLDAAAILSDPGIIIDDA